MWRHAVISKKRLLCARKFNAIVDPVRELFPLAARDSHSPCLNCDNSVGTPAELVKKSCKSCVITCFKCGIGGHIALACNSDSRPARKCYACGGIGHIARVCPTSTAQSAANASSFTFGLVASSCGSVGQLFAEDVIGGMRVAEALVDRLSAVDAEHRYVHATARRSRDTAIRAWRS